MLLTKFIEIRINNRNKNHFKRLGYIIENNYIICNVIDLMKNSRAIVECTCDKCEINKKITYQKYNQYTKNGTENYYCNKCSSIKERKTCMDKYGAEHYSKTNDFKENNKKIWLNSLGVDHPSKSSEVMEKMKETWMNNLGVDHPSKLIQTIEKAKKTNISKYGVDHPMKSEQLKNKIRESNISKGRWHKHDVNLYKGYRKIVDKLTKLNKKILLESWDGYDYYDGEYIKNNFILNTNDKNYPTIDHKISILNGYLNNILPEEISSINNLCITKLYINSSKNYKNECDFKLLKESS